MSRLLSSSPLDAPSMAVGALPGWIAAAGRRGGGAAGEAAGAAGVRAGEAAGLGEGAGLVTTGAVEGEWVAGTESTAVGVTLRLAGDCAAGVEHPTIAAQSAAARTNACRDSTGQE
jgi:hypothetical protein